MPVTLSIRSVFAILLQMCLIGTISAQDSFPVMLNPQKSPRVGAMGGVGKIPLGPTEIMIDGAIFDVSNKFIQRVTAGGTSYFPYLNPGGQPTFMRREMDRQKRYVMIPDYSKPLGGGYFIILRRINNVRIRGRNNEPVYEAFRLRITDYIQAWVRPFFSERQESAAGFGDANMMLQSQRMKRQNNPESLNNQDQFIYEYPDYYQDEKSELQQSNNYDNDNFNIPEESEAQDSTQKENF